MVRFFFFNYFKFAVAAALINGRLYHLSFFVLINLIVTTALG